MNYFHHNGSQNIMQKIKQRKHQDDRGSNSFFNFLTNTFYLCLELKMAGAASL
jgi:hypothetical protein